MDFQTNFRAFQTEFVFSVLSEQIIRISEIFRISSRSFAKLFQMNFKGIQRKSEKFRALRSPVHHILVLPFQAFLHLSYFSLEVRGPFPSHLLQVVEKEVALD